LERQKVHHPFDVVDWPLETEPVSVFYEDDYCV